MSLEEAGPAGDEGHKGRKPQVDGKGGLCGGWGELLGRMGGDKGGTRNTNIMRAMQS